jgi:hypothetical protein
MLSREFRGREFRESASSGVCRICPPIQYLCYRSKLVVWDIRALGNMTLWPKGKASVMIWEVHIDPNTD